MMNAPYRFQAFIVKALDAYRNPVDPSLSVILEARFIGAARIRFYSDFNGHTKIQTGSKVRQQLVDGFTRK